MSTSTFDKSEKRSQQIMAPPMRYDLKQGISQQVLNHLDNLNITTTGPVRDSIERFKQALSLRQENKQYTTFGYIPAPPDSDVTRQVIGKDGYFFKMTTTLCDCDFIWHDRKNQVFLFWGSSKFKVVKALNSIRWRIHKIYTILQKQQQATTTQYDVEDISDDDDDLPSLISYEEIQLEQQMMKMNVSETTECGDVDEND
jgi:hypothetical protein